MTAFFMNRLSCFMKKRNFMPRRVHNPHRHLTFRNTAPPPIEITIELVFPMVNMKSTLNLTKITLYRHCKIRVNMTSLWTPNPCLDPSLRPVVQKAIDAIPPPHLTVPVVRETFTSSCAVAPRPDQAGTRPAKALASTSSP